MTTLNVTLPESLQAFVQGQVARGDFRTASEYLQALVLEDQKRKTPTDLESKLLEGINSGESTPMTKQDWQNLRENLRRRLAQTKST
ncbi:MAG: type II toxin-antitoxin system ParD family antitoxin [Verrucomicrobia bacterium]|nr:type II toxin-antitoxin system ParD family antitoxin [Verrucomicrobiota bacterium]